MKVLLLLVTVARLGAGQVAEGEGQASAKATPNGSETEGAVEGRTSAGANPRFFAGSNNFGFNTGFQQSLNFPQGHNTFQPGVHGSNIPFNAGGLTHTQGTGLGGNLGLLGGTQNVQQSCEFFCENAFGDTVCCDKPGFCPAVRLECPRVTVPPQVCVNDIDCPFDNKCCFDICLCQRVCKPPQLFDSGSPEPTPTQCIG